MNKLKVFVFGGLVLSLCILIVGLYIQPEFSSTIETIKPQIICYGGRC